MTAFLAYALGMGAVVTLVTVFVGAAEHGFVDRLRRVGPWVNRTSGALLVLAGLYVARSGDPAAVAATQMIIGVVSTFFYVPVAVGTTSYIYLRLRGEPG